MTDTANPRPLCAVLLFKRILDFKKVEEKTEIDKRTSKRHLVGAKFPLKARLTLISRDGEGNLITEGSAPMDWGGQLVNVSASGASIRLHPAAIAARGEPCTLKLEIDHVLFETPATIASYRTHPQYVTCGIVCLFPDTYTRKAYLQLIEPVVVGASLQRGEGKVVQDLPSLTKEQYFSESDGLLSIWRDPSDRPKLFELLIHEYYLRGNTELPGLKIGFREVPKIGRRMSRPAFPVAMSADHQSEIARFFRFTVQNLGKGVPPEVRKFLELFAT